MPLTANWKMNSRRIKSFDGQELWTQTYQVLPNRKIKNTVVLVHGLANAGEVWEAVISGILHQCPRTRCIVYDLRGHGRSTKKFSHLSGTRLELIHAFDLKAVLKQLAPWRPVLVGHSMGGIIIQEYLNLEPWWWQSPREVFLLATNTKTRQIKNINRLAIMENFTKINQSEQKPASASEFEEYLKAIGRSDFNWRSIVRVATGIPLESSLLHWLGAVNWENSNPSRIDRDNVMLIYGKNDRIFPLAQIKETLTRSKKMRSKEVDAQHGLNVSAATTVAAEICQVLKK